MTDWSTLAAWAGVILTICGVVGRALSRDLARIDKAVEDIKRDARDESRVQDARIKEAILALDVRLQNELRMLIEASHLRLSALEARDLNLEQQLRERMVNSRRGP